MGIEYFCVHVAFSSLLSFAKTHKHGLLLMLLLFVSRSKATKEKG